MPRLTCASGCRTRSSDNVWPSEGQAWFAKRLSPRGPDAAYCAVLARVGVRRFGSPHNPLPGNETWAEARRRRLRSTFARRAHCGSDGFDARKCESDQFDTDCSRRTTREGRRKWHSTHSRRLAAAGLSTWNRHWRRCRRIREPSSLSVRGSPTWSRSIQQQAVASRKWSVC